MCLHVDFHAVRADEKLHARNPGRDRSAKPAGVKNFGGILEIALHSIEVECLPKDLPEMIRIDVSGLNVGDAIHVKDLQLPEGVSARADGDLTVVRVAAPKVEVEPVAAAVPPLARSAQGKERGRGCREAAAGAKPAGERK